VGPSRFATRVVARRVGGWLTGGGGPSRASWRASLGVAAFVLAQTACLAHAEQPRDFMLSFQPDGWFGSAAFFGNGILATVEHRLPIYGDANSLTTRAEGLASLPLGELSLHGDLRIMNLGFGGSLGYRQVWQNLAFAPGQDFNQDARRQRDRWVGGDTNSNGFVYGEVRTQLQLPLNPYVVFNSVGKLRYEDMGGLAYDWLLADVHDRGWIGSGEVMLFLKHRDWGGIGPYVMWTALPRYQEHVQKIAVGFNAVTRPGLFRRNDMLAVTFLIRPGDDTYGQHFYYLPIRGLIAYRVAWEL
jgi:hypothetical protein